MNVRPHCVALLALLALAGCGARDDGRFTGYAEAELVYVAPGIGGTLRTLAVARGQRVGQGAALFALDTDAEVAARAAAEARLDAAAVEIEAVFEGLEQGLGVLALGLVPDIVGDGGADLVLAGLDGALD
ncbi:MAG: hypothetical protein ACK4V1_13320, partial [Burkholderiaceae bacterium]